MQISITGRHMEITDAIRDHTHEKIQRELLEFPRILSVHAILDVEKYRHKAEVVIHAPNHLEVDARAESDNMYASIDQAVEKAAKQLHRMHEKWQDKKSRETPSMSDINTAASESAEG